MAANRGQKKPIQASRVNKPTDTLPDDMISDVRDCFNFYDTERRHEITRNQFKSILGNFSHYNLTAKEIEEEISRDYESSKQSFSFEDLIQTISKKW